MLVHFGKYQVAISYRSFSLEAHHMINKQKSNLPKYDDMRYNITANDKNRKE